LGLLGTLMPLPFIIVGAYYEARYLLLDLFIKKTGVIIVTGLVAALYYVFVVEPFARYQMWKNIAYPAWLILLPLITTVPFLAQGVKQLIDRYFFKRRFTPAQALSAFSQAIRFTSDEEQLLEILRNYLIDMFSTKHVMVFFSEKLDESNCPIPKLREEFATVKRPRLLNEIQCQETADFCKQNAFEVVVPLLVEEKISGCMALGKRYYKEPYLSEDLNLLNSIADQVEFALENIRLERTRRAQELKEQELTVLASKAELRALRAQINPHFLFNALNTIASLIRKDPQKAEETVEGLAEIFRYTLARSGTDFIPLAEELHFINAYLEVQKVRFGNKLLVEMNVDPQVEGVKIPSMLLQPLVENAIKHGISSKLDGGKVTIGARRENDVLKLEVADNGVGFDSSTSRRLYKDGVGVKNVRDRLRAIYGNEDGFQIQSMPNQGTTVYITIPLGSIP
jgi:K+-sensing histidine kinase KdpD